MGELGTLRRSVVDGLAALGPSVAERAALIEANRTLPDDVVADVRGTGAFRMWVPSRYGGAELGPAAAIDVLENLAYHEGATSWAVMISATTTLLAARMEPDQASELFGQADAIAGGFAAPMGEARSVEGGLQVSGRWAWGSGTRHCTAIGGGARVVDEEPRPDGVMFPFVFFDRDDVTFVDNWDAIGLEGTGSGDYEVTDAFVPAGRWAQIGLDPLRVDGALYRLPFYGLLAAGIAAISIGIVRRGIDDLVELAASKRPQGSRRTLAERTSAQAEIASAEAVVASSRLFLDHALGEAMDACEGGDEPSIELRRQIRLAAADATQRCGDTAVRLHRTAGGESVYRRSPIQRTFRAANVATQHAMVAERIYELVGRIRLGLDTDTSQL